MKYQQRMMIIKLLIISLGHILDMMMLDLEFVEEYIKKRSAKGGQTVMCMDAGRFRIRASMHPHKL